MASLRERPRLVAARVLGVALLLGIGVAIGALADDPGPEIPAQAQAQLKRAKSVSGDRADRLDGMGVTVARLRAELDEAMERTRALARANARLVRDVRRTTRALRRAQRTSRSQSR